MNDIQEIIELLEKSIKLNPENNLTMGEIIADSYDEKVDEYRRLLNNSASWLSDYQAKLIDETKITSLKIKYTNASAYFIEIPKSQVGKIPDYFDHKQTLLNASRYTTEDLRNFSDKYIEAQGRKAEREYEIFLEIREKILNSFLSIKKTTEIASRIDFITSLAVVAYENNYVRPTITKDYDLKIESGKHPVIMQNGKEFISNNLDLKNDKYIHIITGPNMGGKSTFLRQNALIILMAHIGSYVPAKSATIPLTDKILSRVGASDNLYYGQSTFMVEMQEVSNILNNATNRSFVIIDEVGRGTSTYDGMSLAWAILKEMHDKIRAKMLFATHYHELIDIAKEKLKGTQNFSVAVGENDDNLVFLRKIIPGGMKKSFGLEVAKLAGIKSNVIEEAKNMQILLENEHNSVFGNQLTLSSNTIVEYKYKDSLVEKQLEKVDINSISPIEALNELYNLKKLLNEKK